MLVSQMIELLQKLPQDAVCIVSGYEGGYDEVSELDQVTIAKDVYKTSSYYGNHEDITYLAMVENDNKYTTCTAIKIF